MEFNVLGPLEVRGDDGRTVVIGRPKLRALLGLLLLHANAPITVDDLVEGLWGASAPSSATGNVKTYVCALRKLLAAPSGTCLRTCTGGYLLRVAPDELDLLVFRRLSAQGRVALEHGDMAGAAEALERAAALWRGRLLQDVSLEHAATGELTRLEEERLGALEGLVEAQLALGRHGRLIGSLQALVAEQPYRERLWGQLMLALYRSGRQADALAAYRQVHDRLIEDLGVEPGPALRHLERQILAGDAALSPPSPPATAAVSAAAAGGSGQVVPCQLPPDIDDFTGRQDALAAVRRLLDPAADGRDGAGGSPTVVIAAIAGRAGVGKTALAIRAAHQARHLFPDGQLYVDLRGTEPAPVDAAEVAASFCRALGIAADAVPSQPAERVGLYRSLVADRRVLVVLDDAAGEAQVRPLLPAGPTCAAVITSRRHLGGLEAAHAVPLDVLPPDQATGLLARIAGQARVAAEPAAAAKIARYCGGLPLALRVAGVKLVARPQWRLARLAAQLADERRRLDRLKAGDLEVRASIAHGYQSQVQAVRRGFRLLGLLDAPDVAAWAIAALAGGTVEEGERLAERLVDAQLLDAAGEDGAGQLRWCLHPLLRALSRERLREEEPGAGRELALGRLLDRCLALARRADSRLGGPRGPDAAGGSQDRIGGSGMDLASPAAAMAWLEAERATLVSAAVQASALQSPEVSWRLARTLSRFLGIRGYWEDWTVVNHAALDAARRVGQPAAEAHCLVDLSVLRCQQRRYEQATAYFRQALEVGRAAGGHAFEGRCLADLGRTHGWQGRLQEPVHGTEQALVVARALGDRHGEATALDDPGRPGTL